MESTPMKTSTEMEDDTDPATALSEEIEGAVSKISDKNEDRESENYPKQSLTGTEGTSRGPKVVTPGHQGEEEFHSIQGDSVAIGLKSITPQDHIDATEAQSTDHSGIHEDQTEGVSDPSGTEPIGFRVATKSLKESQPQSDNKDIEVDKQKDDNQNVTQQLPITETSDTLIGNPHGTDCQTDDHHNLTITPNTDTQTVDQAPNPTSEMGRSSRKSRDPSALGTESQDIRSQDSAASSLSNSAEQFKATQPEIKQSASVEDQLASKSESSPLLNTVKGGSADQQTASTEPMIADEPLLLSQFVLNDHREWCPCYIVLSKQKIQASFAERGSKVKNQCTMSTLRIPYSNVTEIRSGDSVQDNLYGQLFGLEVVTKAGTFKLGFSTESKREEYLAKIADFKTQFNKRSLPGCFQFFSFLVAPCGSKKQHEPSCKKDTPGCCDKPDSLADAKKPS